MTNGFNQAVRFGVVAVWFSRVRNLRTRSAAVAAFACRRGNRVKGGMFAIGTSVQRGYRDA